MNDASWNLEASSTTEMVIEFGPLSLTSILSLIAILKCDGLVKIS